MRTPTAIRYHDISCGHRVAGHENKCADFHGHNYRIHFECAPGPTGSLDDIGRVIDFSVIKSVLCEWLEENWDHKFLLWEEDEFWPIMDGRPGFIRVPFNPTAENMADHLLLIGNELLAEHGVKLIRVRVDETRKCSAEVTL